MRKQRRDEISAALAMFGFGQLQDFRALVRVLGRSNISIDDFLDFVDAGRAERSLKAKEHQKWQAKAHSIWLKNAKKCPECGKPMYLLPVNTTTCNQVGGSWKCQWVCYNAACMYDELIERPIEEEAAAYNLIRPQGAKGAECNG